MISLTSEVTPELPTNPRTCVSCKHLLGRRDRLEDWENKWKCHHSNSITQTHIHGVTGELINEYRWPSILETRTQGERKCGGDWWEEYLHPATIGGMEATEAFSDADLEVNRKAAAERLAKIRNKKLSSTDYSNL